MAEKKRRLQCGKIVNTHGIRGSVKVESWCDSPAVMKSLPKVYFSEREDAAPIKIRRAVLFDRFVLLDLEGIDDIEKALPLKNKILYADRADLPLAKGAYFLADLLGLPVIDADSGEVYGKLTDIQNLGASDLYEITRPSGKTCLIPAVKEFIAEIDIERGVFIRPIAGMIDDETKDDKNDAL